MKGITLAEHGHFVHALPAIDINGGTSTDIWSMENYSHATIFISQGVVAAASTVTVEECDDFVPTNNTAIAFSYYAETTALGDTLSTRTAATTAGFAMTTTNTTMYVIEIDATALTVGYPCLRVVFSDPGASVIASCVAILSGPRYAQEQTATAIV